MGEILFKRPGGKVWQAYVKERSGKWTTKSTHCTDKRAAGVVLVAWALANADGGPDETLFSPWANMVRDLAVAAKRLGIEPFNATDLRRTFGTMLRNAGVEPQLIAPAMGHVDGRMTERVYGRLTPEALGALLDARVGERRLRSAQWSCPAEVRSPALRPLPPYSRPAEAPRSRAPLRGRRAVEGLQAAGRARRVRDMCAVVGRSRGVLAEWDTTPTLPLWPRNRPFTGAQGRNRTADTGIFSPTFLPELNASKQAFSAHSNVIDAHRWVTNGLSFVIRALAAIHTPNGRGGSDPADVATI